MNVFNVMWVLRYKGSFYEVWRNLREFVLFCELLYILDQLGFRDTDERILDPKKCQITITT